MFRFFPDTLFIYRIYNGMGNTYTFYFTPPNYYSTVFSTSCITYIHHIRRYSSSCSLRRWSVTRWKQMIFECFRMFILYARNVILTSVRRRPNVQGTLFSRTRESESELIESIQCFILNIIIFVFYI